MPKVTRLNVREQKMFQQPVNRTSHPQFINVVRVKANGVPLFAKDWEEQLENELDLRQFQLFLTELREQYERGTVYPCWDDIFRAFTLTSFKNTRVVIIGQDPYHGAGQAHGLCFSVPKDQRFPPSLRNIFKELECDLSVKPTSGDLSGWAEQGVLLLNAVLTVRAGEAGSHGSIGWSTFTDAVIRSLSKKKQGLIFLLWGTFAQQKAALIDNDRHFILKAPHPSPLSAHRGFIGCGHFSKVNELLKERGEIPIKWDLG